jgi:pimeloyl-ACP methyl ester carboxylesterase
MVGAGIHYEIEGAGSPVVFINPGALDCRIWNPQWPVFSRRNLALRYDPRGFRGSSRPSEPFSHLSDLLALLDAAGISRAHLIGSSFGGSLALDFAALHPERVASLTLVGAGGPQNGFPMPSELFRTFAPIGEAMKESFARGIEVWLEVDERMPRDAKLRALLREMALENEGYWKIPPAWVAPLVPPVRERLRDLDVPTLAIVGERDLGYTLDVALELERSMPRARRVMVPGAGHLAHFEEPGFFNDLVLSEIEALNGGQG